MPRTYKAGQPRGQGMLLPPRIDDYIAPGNPVRTIDAYVESLDLGVLGVGNTPPGSGSGQPPFPPAALLKLYLYGYLNRVHSSRRLEREALRNLEAIWLVQGLRPGYKTLANFRKDNSLALKAANRDFLLLCKVLSLFGGEAVAVDGSFFKADASTDGVFTAKKLDEQLAALEKKIDAYPSRLAEQDAQDDRAGLGSLVEDDELADKLARLKERQAEKQSLRNRLKQSADGQLSTMPGCSASRARRQRATTCRLPSMRNISSSSPTTPPRTATTANSSCPCWKRPKTSCNPNTGSGGRHRLPQRRTNPASRGKGLRSLRA